MASISRLAGIATGLALVSLLGAGCEAVGGADCAWAVAVADTIGTSCSTDPCPQPGAAEGVTLDCVAGQAPGSDAGCYPDGACELVCDGARWPGTACPPNFACNGIYDEACGAVDPLGLCVLVACGR